MSNAIHQLAKIPLQESIFDKLELNKVFENFAKNYKKLDELKNFRSEYEQRNFLSRWWDNDKLRDAQLDSAEVQAEFSKTLGQLVAISVIQAKELNEQQRRLEDQQSIIKEQVITIRKHSKEIEKQQNIQEEQAENLKQLVSDYIAVKGISDDSIHRLAKIVSAIDKTKEEFFAESRRVNNHLSSELTSLGECTRSALNEFENKVNARNSTLQNSLLSLEDSLAKNHQSLSSNIKTLSQNQANLKAKLVELESASRIELELLDEKTASKFHAVDGSLQGLGARVTATEQEVRENAERAIHNLMELEKKIQELTDTFHHVLALLDEKTTSKFHAIDGSLQGLEARTTAAEQQVSENAERANHLESENSEILKGFISLQKEMGELKMESKRDNQRVRLFLIFASISFLATLGTLGMQLFRI